MRISENSYDWLGPGMYFWENDSDRALEWAKAKYPKASAIVGAYIDLGLCLDFMSSAFLDLLTPAYESIATPELPENSGSMLLRPRDCAVIMAIHQTRVDHSEAPFDTVRGVFWEGDEVYPTAGFYKRNHIQIAVRNPNCIKGFFLPRKKNEKFPTP